MSKCKLCGSLLAVGSACLVCLGASRFEVPAVSPESLPIVMTEPEMLHTVESGSVQQLVARPVAVITTESNFVPRFINPFAQYAPEPQAFISPMPRMSAALLWSNATTTAG